MVKKLTLPLVLLAVAAALAGCSSPEPAPDTSKIVDQSKAPSMDGSVGAEGAGAPSGSAPAPKNDEGG